MNLIQQLIARFHSLHGNTVPEKWRNYNTFRESLRSSSNTLSDLNDFICSVTPKDSLEEAFRIETMIGLNLHEPILHELKNNNQLLIRKLLKNRKVFTEMFSNLDPRTFIEDIFLHLSYVMKLKLLHGIKRNVKDETLIDKYFLMVESRYGSKLAANVLAGCSVSLIRTKIERFYVRLSDQELTSILKRDKDFLQFYLSLYKKNTEPNEFVRLFYSKSYRKFSRMYPEMYWKVNDAYNMDVVFGRRATPKMFQHRNPILKSGNDFLNYFSKLDRLYRAAKRRGELQILLASLFPATHHEFVNMYLSSNVEQFMKKFPPAQKFTILSEVFKEKFSVDLLDFPEYCKICLHIIPVQLRHSIIDKLITQDESLIIFYHTSKSIPIIKNKLQHCGDADYRARLTGWMFRSCTTNENSQALMEALDYVWSRHKNDIIVLTVFFNSLMNLSDVAKLSDASWEIISDTNKVMEISRPQYNNSTFYCKLFMHLIENGKSLEEHCKRRLEEIMNTSDYISTYNIQQFAPRKYERIYLEEIGKHFLLFRDHRNYQIVCISYLLHLTEFNISKQGKINPIDLNSYSKLYHQIKTTDCYGSIYIIKYGLKHHGSDEIWHNLFWKLPRMSMDNRALAEYLQEWPQKFTDNLDKVLGHFQPYFLKFFVRQAKRSLDRNSLEKLKEHALYLLGRNRYDDIKSGVHILAIIAPEMFLNIAETLIANTAIGKCNKNEFTQKKMMIKELHRLGNLKDALSLILRYCNTGSCFRYASIPLWGIAYHTAENYIKEELIKFADGPLSARKTVLILSKVLFKSDDFAQVLQILDQEESDTSMKHIIFEKIFEYLQENPSECFWNFFKASVSSIDTNREMYESLMNIPKIPIKYLPEYIPMVYEKISSNPLWEIQKTKFDFLEAIPNEIIDSLDMRFLKRIIKETACREKGTNFHWKSVFFTDQVKRYELLETNFKAIDGFIRENRPHLYRNGTARNTVTNFVSRFVEVSLILKQHGDLIEKFIVLWNSIEGSGIFDQSYLTVRFTDTYFKSDFDSYKMGLRIRKLLDDYVSEIGLSVIPIFSDRLNTFLNTTGIKDRNEVPIFANGLSEGSLDGKIYALVVNLLTKDPPKICDQQKYGATLQAIMKCEDPMVKFHLDKCLQDVGFMNL